MTESLSELRRKADHIRLLLHGIGDKRTRSILLAMANEYDNRAGAAEGRSEQAERDLVDH